MTPQCDIYASIKSNNCSATHPALFPSESTSAADFGRTHARTALSHRGDRLVDARVIHTRARHTHSLGGAERRSVDNPIAGHRTMGVPPTRITMSSRAPNRRCLDQVLHLIEQRASLLLEARLEELIPTREHQREADRLFRLAEQVRLATRELIEQCGLS